MMMKMQVVTLPTTINYGHFDHSLYKNKKKKPISFTAFCWHKKQVSPKSEPIFVFFETTKIISNYFNRT